MKKHTRSMMALLLLVGAVMANIVTTQAVEPRYTGISYLSSVLTISTSGGAACTGKVKVRDGYQADVKVELKQDGTTIKTWTDSGSGTITISEARYVASGHNYVLTTTATVYDSNGKLVENPSVDSDVVAH